MIYVIQFVQSNLIVIFCFFMPMSGLIADDQIGFYKQAENSNVESKISRKIKIKDKEVEVFLEKYNDFHVHKVTFSFTENGGVTLIFYGEGKKDGWDEEAFVIVIGPYVEYRVFKTKKIIGLKPNIPEALLDSVSITVSVDRFQDILNYLIIKDFSESK